MSFDADKMFEEKSTLFTVTNFVNDGSHWETEHRAIEKEPFLEIIQACKDKYFGLGYDKGFEHGKKEYDI